MFRINNKQDRAIQEPQPNLEVSRLEMPQLKWEISRQDPQLSLQDNMQGDHQRSLATNKLIPDSTNAVNRDVE